ncbi:MAG TPA: NmrA family NAD(P)-binding protein [Leptospiraceae bacterium]|nr:NmrA family NAD(P)-binding protein [Leptospiraceae bacterium]HMW03457.1 NmrA family NAD(P)-binding protein [Leptospiraceae bacterium]HMX31590.1 NmrA family NAD(P)-binding protein [Leptospiraceae bacterium]HMY29623.1 NmrA family NAD(P)-binding protein [Leptospiraceae bacterium]HMZ62887.1 NmrA family NAD(P)-binding protein [Leptospiraceae bacterium]
MLIKKIGIIGATGMLGKPVVKALLAAGFEVYAMVRDIIKAKIELPIGVNLVVGDIGNPVEIENFLKQVEAIHLNLSIKQTELEKEFHTEEQGLKLLLEIAKRRGIKRISYLSSLLMNYQGTNGFHWWVFTIKQNAVQQIKNSGIPYTIFYPSTFMENILHRQINGDKLRLAGLSRYKMFFIAGDDYARQVANSYKILRAENREYPVQGLFPYTSDEAATLFAKFYKKEILKVQKMPMFLLSFLSRFSPKFDYLYKIIYSMNHYHERFQSELTWKELGKPILTIEEYAANHK